MPYGSACRLGWPGACTNFYERDDLLFSNASLPPICQMIRNAKASRLVGTLKLTMPATLMRAKPIGTTFRSPKDALAPDNGGRAMEYDLTSSP